MLENKKLQENIQRWGRFYPKEAKDLSDLICSHVQFSQSNSSAPNLQEEVDGKIQHYHSILDPVTEANEWFTSLDLYQVNVLYVYGVGLGYYYDAAKNWLQDESHFLVFLESNPEVIYRLFETERATQILHDKQVRLIKFDVNDPTESTWESLALLFWRGQIRISALRSYEKHDPATMQHVMTKLSFWTTYSHGIFSEYNDYGQHYYVNFYSNLFNLPRAYRGNKLFGQFSGIPAIICGAGPSLDKNLAVLETLGERVLIFAGGTAMNAVNSRGFLPHFGLGIDPNIEQLSRLIMNTAYEVPFFYRNRMNHNALNMVHSPSLYVTGAGGYKASAWFENQLGIEGDYVDEGFNVVNFSLSLAYAMGCNPIIFVGLDLAYSDEKSYQSGVIHHPIHNVRHDFRTKGSHEELLVKDDIFGKPVHTLWKWVSESSWLSQFASKHSDVLFINGTEGGIGMPGIPNKSLSEIAEYLLPRQFDLSVSVHGELENSHMLSSVTQDRVIELVKLITVSLKKCQEYCQVLFLESLQTAQKFTESGEGPEDLMTETARENFKKLSKESGYQNILKDFDESYLSSIKIDLEQLKFDESLSPVDRLANEAHLQARRYEFLRNASAINFGLAEYALQQKEVEEETGNIAVKKAVLHRQKGEVYSIKSDRVTVIDPELGINYQDEKPAQKLEAKYLYYGDGTKKLEQFYQDGKLHGSTTFYNREGKVLAQSWHIKGVRQGRAVFYYNSGELHSIHRFNNGCRNGLQQYYYRNGCLKTVMNFKMGKLNGDVLMYFPDGGRKRELHFTQGKRNGFEKIWAPGERLMIEAEYLDDRPAGIARTWFPNGQLGQETIYGDNSQSISVQQWDEAGRLLPPLIKDDYFEAVAKHTHILTESLQKVCQDLESLAPNLPMDIAPLKKGFEEMMESIKQLQIKSLELKEESGLNAESSKEAIWKTPISKREIEKQIKDVTSKLSGDISIIQQLIKQFGNTQ